MALLAAMILYEPAVAKKGEDSGVASSASSTKSDRAEKGSGTRVRLGGVLVGAGYSHFSGYGSYGFPYFYNPIYSSYFWPGWEPFYPSYGWLGGFVHPGYYGGFHQGPGMGEVKLKTTSRQAAVYLDGGYAGVAKDLKNLWLRPGAYNLEVRGDNETFEQRIYVLSGKTLRIEARLSPASENEP